MLSFNGFVAEHYLTELLTSPLPFRWLPRAHKWSVWQAEFKTPTGQAYDVRFQLFDTANDEFSHGDGSDTPAWGFVFRNATPNMEPMKRFDILGTGEAIPIFATVIAILRDFIQRVRPERINFSAEEPSRIKLYDRFIRMIQQQQALPNYTARGNGRGEYVIMRRS